MAARKRRSGRPGSQSDAAGAAPEASRAGAAPAASGWLEQALPVRRVPDGVEYTGILRTATYTPLLAFMGIIVGIGSFYSITPLVARLLGGAYWLAIGRPGTFAETYASLLRYEHPFGMVAAQLGLATLIPISVAILRLLHQVRPGYVFSVAGRLRWRPLWVFLGVALVTLNAVLWVNNALLGRTYTWAPQAGLAWFLVAIVLTSPLQAAAEEVFFRGYLLLALGSQVPGKWFGILASAFVFALFHGTQNPWLFGSRFAFGVLADRVSVVPNTVHPAMTSDPDPAQVAQFRALRVPGATTFAYVTRLYPHKNLPFVAPVLAELARLGTEARCFVTLTDAEWAALGQAGQSRLVNVGSLTPPQVRALLEASDAVLFPSLLEAFSATPIEALQVERPLFASDRDFVRTVVGDAAWYFDPTDVRAAAAAIQAGLADTDALAARVACGRALMRAWPDATSRTRAFLATIDGALTRRGA